MKEFDFEKVPIVEIANTILLDGVKKGASDIHFDPSKESLKIRMRVDGILYDYSIIPGEYKKNITSRIKMIASMNIMETRLPQDGAIKSKIGDKELIKLLILNYRKYSVRYIIVIIFYIW